jgi:hypothetical protein
MMKRDSGWSRRARGPHAVAALGAVAVTLCAGSALAERFGERGQLAITGENLVGYQAEHRQWDDYANQTQETNRGGLALGLQRGGARLGFHYFLLPQFSVGGSLGYDRRTGKNTVEDGDGTYSVDLAAENTLDVGLRAGYALMFTDVVGFWFRGGPGMERSVRRPIANSEDDADIDSVWLVSLDVLFVVAPVPHFGLYLGPSGDVAFAGQHKEKRSAPPPTVPDEWDERESMQRIGFGFGLIGTL